MIQNRNIGLAIIFSIITCGIYTFYWMYKIFEETRILCKDMNGSASLDLLLTIVTCGIYGFYAVYQASKRMYEVDYAHGDTHASDDSVLITILYALVSIVSLAILQSKINKYAI